MFYLPLVIATKQWKFLETDTISLLNKIFRLTLVLIRSRDKKEKKERKEEPISFNVSCDSFAIWYTFLWETKKRKNRSLERETRVKC